MLRITQASVLISYQYSVHSHNCIHLHVWHWWLLLLLSYSNYTLAASALMLQCHLLFSLKCSRFWLEIYQNMGFGVPCLLALTTRGAISDNCSYLCVKGMAVSVCAGSLPCGRLTQTHCDCWHCCQSRRTWVPTWALRSKSRTIYGTVGVMFSKNASHSI